MPKLGGPTPSIPSMPYSLDAQAIGAVIAESLNAERAAARAHEDYLRLSNELTRSMTEILAFQLRLAESLSAGGPVAERPALPPALLESIPGPFMDRQACLEFAVGSIGRVLGPKFADIDAFPTRVRLPDEPLMLVDRIVTVDGEPLSMTSGRVVTEHDVRPDGWYLDGGRIATCVAIEAGQADLFLSAWLGADFQTRGLAMYRLLDAEVTFLAGLPEPGEVIRYDIHIDHFFRHGPTHLFRFRFDGTVDGRLLLTMRGGCAGFFSPAELAAGKGIIRSLPEHAPELAKKPADWDYPVSMVRESYDDRQLDALRRGDLAGCFGQAFAGIEVKNPLTLPDGRMRLVHRVPDIDPNGGPYGLGCILAEQDIHPGDWFLSCHFIDDQVMPGTLMYECSLHALRIFLLRLGWVAEKGRAVFEPVPGVKGKLKCRGQVIESTRKASYEIFVKELGYGPEPYAVADGIMYADGRAVVEISDLSVRLTGTDREQVRRLWANKPPVRPDGKPALFGRDHILTFAEGKPSEAFGEPYQPFDQGRYLARLPRPPFSFIDRVTGVKAEPFRMKAGGEAETQFDLQPGAWYFRDNRQGLPYAVLLEAALQSCGWLTAYMGSALTSPVDLYFRNLGWRGDRVARSGSDGPNPDHHREKHRRFGFGRHRSPELPIRGLRRFRPGAVGQNPFRLFHPRGDSSIKRGCRTPPSGGPTRPNP